MDPFNARLAEKKVSDFDGVIEARLPETYQWIIAPEQRDLTGKIEWQAIRLTGTGNLAPRAFARLERDGLIVSTLAGLFLRRELDRVLWVDHDHVSVRQVQEYFAQYLYLPRLTYRELIVEAVRDGVASLTWRSDTFAYAGDYDAVTKRYQGLQAGRSGVAVVADGRSVIVRPNVATAQSDREATATSGGDHHRAAFAMKKMGLAAPLVGTAEEEPSFRVQDQTRGGSGGGTPPLPPTRAVLGSIGCSISVEPTKLGNQANRIAAEVLQTLAQQARRRGRSSHRYPRSTARRCG